MALGRKQEDPNAGLVISGGDNEFGRMPAAPDGQRYVRDLDAAAANAVRASVQAYRDSKLPIPPRLAAQLAAIGEDVQPEIVLEPLGAPVDPFAPGNIPIPPLVPKPIDWSGQGHLDPPDQTEAPAQSEAPAAAPAPQTPPPGPVSTRAQAAAEAAPAPADEAKGIDLPTGTPVTLPEDVKVADIATAQTPEPAVEAAPTVEAKPAPEPAVEEPKPQLKTPEPAPAPVAEETKPEEAKPQTVAAARKAAAKKAAPKAQQRK